MHWLPHTTSCWQSIHIAQAKKEMVDVKNIPRVSYLWNFSFALGNSFISVIHKEVTHASWKGRLSQNKMLNWASLFNNIDRKTFPTIPAYARYWVETCPRSFLLPEKWATQPQREPTEETMQCIDSTYFFNVGFCGSTISSPVWLLTVIHHRAGPGDQNDVS